MKNYFPFGDKLLSMLKTLTFFALGDPVVKYILFFSLSLGQLLSFYIVSLLWAGDIIMRENLFSIRQLWEGYPHSQMTFMFKFFFIVQLAYWLHIFPELYFQKVSEALFSFCVRL